MKHGYILLWPHGMKNKDNILEIINNKFKVVYHKSFEVDNLEKFMYSLYTKENKAFIRSKNNFLLKKCKDKQIYLYIFENHLNDIKLYNDTKKSETEWDLKIHIRNLYNPKFSNKNRRIKPLDKGISHDHVIHSSDTSEEMPHICSLLKIDYNKICVNK